MSSTPNRLIEETSPYLLQHAHNPVDWYPWGAEALERARTENRPILLSVGYSSCHWCHVMERESFEDPETAALMNAHFVCVKVDREERPDLDEVYMAATMALNQGHGGWPMTVFLTPETKPFFAGTYYPPEDTQGRPGFKTLLRKIGEGWQQNPSHFKRAADELTNHLQGEAGQRQAQPVGLEAVEDAVDHWKRRFDPVWGGFGGAPKFPPTSILSVLMAYHRRTGDAEAMDMVVKTLDRMMDGGIHDQLAGGFSRYAVDARWLVPHFEKMLYDNALLVLAYVEAFELTGHKRYEQVVRKTLDFVGEAMRGPEGAFYSAIDADSEGEEGKYYVWDEREVRENLTEEEAKAFCAYYDVTPGGNWEGKSILHVKGAASVVAKELGLPVKRLETLLEGARKKLLAVRAKRQAPALDDKVLTSWNALMIAAFARAGKVLGEATYLEKAKVAAAFLRDHMGIKGGGVLRAFRSGKACQEGVLEDYAYLAWAMVLLGEASGEEGYGRCAGHFLETLATRFLSERGGFYSTAHDHEELIFRPMEGTDGATPSPNAVAAMVFAKLGMEQGRQDYVEIAHRAIGVHGEALSLYPQAFPWSLLVLEYLLATQPGCKEGVCVVGQALEQGATEEATLAYAERFGKEGYHSLHGLWVAKIGFGSYRVDEENPAYESALRKALETGCNLIDTSSNYTDGGSERCIGRALTAMVQAGTLRREEVVLVSKAGYVQGGNLRMAQQRERAGKPWPEMVKMAENLWHCIHPEFLEDQLRRSLSRLRVQKLDFLLLHNPEYFLMEMWQAGKTDLEANRERFYERIEGAFAFLEKQVADGRLRGYGVSSNTVASDESDPDTTSLPRFLEAARKAARDSDHHFQVLQLPLNLIEGDPVLLRKHEGRSVLEVAVEEGVAVLTNRPLNTFQEGKLLRLVDSPISLKATHLPPLFASLRGLEEEWRTTFAPQVRTGEGSIPSKDFFNVGATLEGLKDIPSMEAWEQMEQNHLIPQLSYLFQSLDQVFKGENQRHWSQWRDRYFEQLVQVFEEYRRQGAIHSKEHRDLLKLQLDKLLPADRREEPLQRVALWAVASCPGVVSVLNGMRRSVYVSEAAEVRGWTDFTNPKTLFEAASSFTY